jgi:hypothetical protein
MVATGHGPGLSPDAVTYISAARNLAAGHGYIDLTGQANTTFAPGFPAILAAGEHLGLGILDGVRLLNAASFGAIVLLTWVLARRHIASRQLALATTAFVAISPALLNVAGKAWSEPLFCVVLLAFIVVVETARASPEQTGRMAAVAGLIAGAGFLVRYAALALIITGMIALIAPGLGLGIRARLSRTAMFALTSALFPALWLVRNANTGAPFVFGPRVASTESPWHLIVLLLGGVESLFVPATATVLWVLVALPVAVLAAAGLRAVLRDRLARLDQPPLGVVPLVAFVGVYLAFIVLAGKVSGASVEARTVMPVYVPVVLLTGWLLSHVPNTSPWFRRVADRRAGWVLAGAFLCVYGAWFGQAVWSDASTSPTFIGPAAVASPLAKTVRRLPSAAVVVSNAPWTLYFASGHQPVLPRPGPLVPSASLVPPSVDTIADVACSKPVYVAWYGRPSRSATPRVLPRSDLIPVVDVRDGTLYRFDAKPVECVPTQVAFPRPPSRETPRDHDGSTPG